jgi:hypothetical protein
MSAPETDAGGGMVTATTALADADALPALPLHAIEYVVAAESGPTCSLPNVARAPVHPPDAVHVVAFVEDQLSVVMLPCMTFVGAADNVTVGVAPGGGLLPPPPPSPPPPPPQLDTTIAQAAMSSRASILDMIDLPYQDERRRLMQSAVPGARRILSARV